MRFHTHRFTKIGKEERQESVSEDTDQGAKEAAGKNIPDKTTK